MPLLVPRPTPPERAREYRAGGWWLDRTLTELLQRHAAARPDASAIVAGEHVLTLQDLDRQSDRVAAGLAGLGVGRGDVVNFAERAQAAGLPTTPEMANVNVYETIYVLKDLVARKGVSNRPDALAKDRERIMQGLTETTSFQGLAGKFGFNKDGDGVKDMYVMMVKGGRWTQVDFAPVQQ